MLDLTPDVPKLVWGRDELGAGEMWNSNSIISWLIARSGLDAEAIQLQPVGALQVGVPGSSWRAVNRDDLGNDDRGEPDRGHRS